MRFTHLAALGLFILGTLPAAIHAEIALYLSDGQGDAHAAEIAPGESFDVQVGLGTTTGLLGMSYWFRISENGSGRYALGERVVDLNCPFTDLISSNTELLQPEAALLDPINDRDLGGLVWTFPVALSPGIYPMAVVTFDSSPDVPAGTYTLSIANAVGVSPAFDELPITAAAYTIVVAPATDPGSGDPGSGGEDPGTGGSDPGTGSGAGDGSGGNTGGGTEPGSGTGDTGSGTGGTTGDTGNGQTDTGGTGGTSDGAGGGSNSGVTGDATGGNEPVDSSTGNDTIASSGGSDNADQGTDNLNSEPRDAVEEATRAFAGCGAGASGAAVVSVLLLGLIRPMTRRR